jgi:hypothetical protein
VEFSGLDLLVLRSSVLFQKKISGKNVPCEVGSMVLVKNFLKFILNFINFCTKYLETGYFIAIFLTSQNVSSKVLQQPFTSTLKDKTY